MATVCADDLLFELGTDSCDVEPSSHAARLASHLFTAPLVYRAPDAVIMLVDAVRGTARVLSIGDVHPSQRPSPADALPAAAAYAPSQADRLFERGLTVSVLYRHVVAGLCVALYKRTALLWVMQRYSVPLEAAPRCMYALQARPAAYFGMSWVALICRTGAHAFWRFLRDVRDDDAAAALAAIVRVTESSDSGSESTFFHDPLPR